MKLIGWVLRGARYKDDVLEVGDLAIHGEEAFPEESFATRSDGAFAMAGIGTRVGQRTRSDAIRWRRWVHRPGTDRTKGDRQ